MRAIGLMSGTSFDGVDVALLETDGERITRFGPSGGRSYSEAERAILRQALQEARTMTDRTARPGVLAEAERIVTDAHAAAVAAFLRDNGIAPASIDVIGFHGQTVLHRPASSLTVQIGDGPQLARRLGIPVVYDLRAADMAAGGQGAPFVPVYHRALADYLGLPRPVVIINIGGVSNVTWIGADGELLAFDTGPGNALLDDLVAARTGQRFDEDGWLAARGTVNQELLRDFRSLPYFSKKTPKSLDRHDFDEVFQSVLSLATEDAAATLTACTAEAIACAIPHFPAAPVRWIVAGGGARNPSIMKALAARLDAPVVTAEDAGLRSDAVEAQAFAYLAVRSLKGLPLTFPGTTGVAHPLSGGVLAQAR